MDTSLVEPPVATELMLRVIKDALWRYRRSSNRRLLGFVRGLELAVPELEEAQSVSLGSVVALRQRMLTLAQSQDDYDLGVAIGIAVAIGMCCITSYEIQSPGSA